MHFYNHVYLYLLQIEYNAYLLHKLKHSCSFQVVLALLQSCQIFMLSGIPVESQQVCASCNFPLFGAPVLLDVGLGHYIAIGSSLLAGWHLGLVSMIKQNIAALGTSLDMVQSAPTAFRLVTPIHRVGVGTSLSHGLKVEWAEGPCKDLMKSETRERKWCIGGKKLRRYIELVKYLAIPVQQQARPQVRQCIKFLNVALTNEGKHTLQNSNMTVLHPARLPFY